MKKKFSILLIMILMLISVTKAQKKEEKVSSLDYNVNIRVFKETPTGKKELIAIKHIHVGEDKYYRENIKINDDLRLKVTIDFDELLHLRIYEKNKLLFLIGSREIKKGEGRKISYFEFRFKHNMKLYFIEIGSSMVRIGPISGGVLSGSVSHKKNKNKKDKKK